MLEFPFAIAEIWPFLGPVFDSIVNENELQKHWMVNMGWLI